MTEATHVVAPRLAVLYDHGSVDVFRFADAGRGLWRTVWLVDQEFEPVGNDVHLLRRTGTVVDITGLAPVDAAATIGEVDGLVVMNEVRLATGAALAPMLGVDFFSPEVVTRLTDKGAQRAAMHAAGVPAPAFVVVPPGSDLEACLRLANQVPLPAVLKPAHGRSSRMTTAVDRPEDLVAALTAAGLPTAEPFVVEERIRDSWRWDERPDADYVSVESFYSRGEFSHFSVTGRRALAEGFREGGAILPSGLPRAEWRSLFEVAEAAIASVGAHAGVFHTEIKQSPQGPRVIEVNGRLGAGSLTWLAERVAGESLLRAVGRVALGQPVHFDGPTFDGVGFFYLFQPPMEARRVSALSGIEEVRRLPGVEDVTVVKPVGSALDPRIEGTLGTVFTVRGRVTDHEALWALFDLIRLTARVEYDA